jgi:hypothetical protein
MANNVQETKNKALAILSVIHSINDDPNLQGNDALKDSFIKDLPSQPGQFGKKLSDLKGKLKKKNENVSNIFKDLTQLCETFLGTSQKYEAAKYNLPVKNRLRQIIEESVDITMSVAQQIILESAQETLFAGDGICGSDAPMPADDIAMGPGDFDFLNLLTISPLSNMGNVLYENVNEIGSQLNRGLYSLFTPTGQTTYTPSNPYKFKASKNTTLFSVYWDDTLQQYKFTGLTGNSGSQKVGTFLKDYFASLHKPGKEDVLRTALMMLSMGDENSEMIDISLKDLNRVLEKIFGNCGKHRTTGLNQNEPQFEENDDDIIKYFDFDDVEGIDLDDESRRFRKVMKFKNCYDVEVPVRPQHFEDFVVLSKNKNLNNALDSALNNIANNAKLDADNGLPAEDFKLNLNSDFNLTIPKAMIAVLLTPKFLLPIVMVYKLVNGGLDKIKTMMKKLYKLFFKIIRKLFWKFINEFWLRVKKDLLDFLKITALNILKEKYLRYYAIVAALIALLKKVLDSNMDNCQVLYKLVVQTIETALSAASFSLNIPGFLLSLASMRSGYSSTRAIMNVTKMANKKGVNTQPIYGNTNKLNHVFSSMVKGHDEENSMNSKIMSGNQFTVIPIPGLSGPLILPPGIIKTAGIKL